MDGVHFGADAFDDIERVRVRQRPDAHEHGAFAAEAHLGIVILRAEHHVGDVAQAHELVAVAAHDEIFEFIHGTQIRVRRQIHRDQRTFRLADGGKKIVRRQRRADFIRTDVERREPVRFEPDAHRERASAEDVRRLHAFERGQARLHDAREIIRDLVRLQNVRSETQVARGELRIRRGDGQRGNFRLGRQIVADLIHLGADFGERLFGIVI